MKFILIILLCWTNFYSPETLNTIDVWNSGYNARWVLKQPRTKNPYKIGTKNRELWDDAWGYNGWMPNIIK